MAIYHLNVRYTGKSERSKSSARSKYLYVTRQGKYGPESHHEPSQHVESGNMPSWASGPESYWAAADTFERANGKTSIEFEMALPIELNLDQNIELIRAFAKKVAGKSIAYSFAIHPGKGSNPHVHFICSFRHQDGIDRTPEVFFSRQNKKKPEKGGAPKGRFGKLQLKNLRKLWEMLANSALYEAGCQVRIDHRSFHDQGIDKIPQIHIGPKRRERGNQSAAERYEANEFIIEENRRRALCQKHQACFRSLPESNAPEL